MDETIARELQRRYLEGDGRALSGLYAELRYLGSQMLRGRADAQDISHLAASRLIERYIRHPIGYRIRHFSYMVSREVAHALAGNGDGKTREYQLAEEPVDTTSAADAPQPIDYATELQQTDTGRRALLDLWASWGYRRAVQTIAEYAGREWIYARAVQLHTLYRIMHRGKGGKGGKAVQPGPRRMGGNGTPVQGIRALLQLRGEQHAQTMEPSKTER